MDVQCGVTWVNHLCQGDWVFIQDFFSCIRGCWSMQGVFYKQLALQRGHLLMMGGFYEQCAL